MDIIIEQQLDRLIKEHENDNHKLVYALIEKKDEIVANIFTKSSGLVCGNEVIKMFFMKVNPKIKVTILKKDGTFVNRGDVLVKVQGSARDIIQSAPLAVGILQQMISISSMVKRYLLELNGLNPKLFIINLDNPQFINFQQIAIETSLAYIIPSEIDHFYYYLQNQMSGNRSVQEDIKKIRSLDPEAKIEVQVSSIEEYELIKLEAIQNITFYKMKKEDMNHILENKVANLNYGYRGSIELKQVRSFAKELNLDYIELENVIRDAKAVELEFHVYKTNWSKSIES